jgi:uncharacterized membrane protein YphA (DoxX/SURF4 family)
MSPSLSRDAFVWWGPFASAARLTVGFLFFITGLAKLADMGRFVEEVRTYEILPLVATNSVAFLVPWIELVVGGFLMLCLWRREARFVIAVMLVVFTAAKALAYARGLQIECGCGGGIPLFKHIFDLPQGILTNVVLLGFLWADWKAEHLKGKKAPHPNESTGGSPLQVKDFFPRPHL